LVQNEKAHTQPRHNGGRRGEIVQRIASKAAIRVMSRTKNAVKKHQADAALIQQQIESLEQKANLLKAEIQRTKVHNALVEIITKFQKNALHYEMVLCDEITEKIKQHPGLPDIFKDWVNSELAKKAAEHGKGDTDDGEAAESFAVHTVKLELEARGNSIDRIGSDPLLAALVVQRLIEYKKAYLRRQILFLKKECPDVQHQDSEMAAAASAGFALANGYSDEPEVKKWLEKITGEEKSLRSVPHLWSTDAKARSENLARCFRRALAGQQKAKWRQPALDSWLLLVWPLVEAEKWNYATVYYLAEMKFPDFKGKPMRSANAMSRHCKLTLGLRINNPKGGRPKNSGFGLGLKLSPLHKFATTIGDSFPDFSSFAKFP
jgi:hypothetical protein